MIRSMVLLVQPPQHPSEFDDEHEYARCRTQEEWKARWDEYLRLQKVFRSLGFVSGEEKDWRDGSHGCKLGVEVELDGLNWDAKGMVEPWTLSEQNLKILEGRAEEVARLREQALAKLSSEEQVALELLKQV